MSLHADVPFENVTSTSNILPRADQGGIDMRRRAAKKRSMTAATGEGGRWSFVVGHGVLGIKANATELMNTLYHIFFVIIGSVSTASKKCSFLPRRSSFNPALPRFHVILLLAYAAIKKCAVCLDTVSWRGRPLGPFARGDLSDTVNKHSVSLFVYFGCIFCLLVASWNAVTPPTNIRNKI